jgi:hypothetical protein
MSRVTVFAPCAIAAVSPTTMYFTPRVLSSSKNRRSTSLRAETVKNESLSQAFFYRPAQVPKHVIDTGNIHPGMATRDLLGAPPQRIAGLDPAALLVGHR